MTIVAVFSRRISWYDYQERCLKDGSFVLYKRSTTGKDAKENEAFWTPIFRSHTIVSGKCKNMFSFLHIIVRYTFTVLRSYLYINACLMMILCLQL